jgi:hypothetical protein
MWGRLADGIHTAEDEGVKTFEARVVKGRLVLDEPSSLPEGTTVRLVAADEEFEFDLEDEMDAEERAELNASLKRGMADVRAGRTRPAREVIAELRAKK